MKSLRDIELDPEVVEKVMAKLSVRSAHPTLGYTRTYTQGIHIGEPFYLRAERHTCPGCGRRYCVGWHP